MTLKLRHPSEIFAHGVSPSMLSLWLMCKRKWWLRYVAGQFRNDTDDQRSSGNAIHKFLQTYYSDFGYFLTPEEHVELLKDDFPQTEESEKIQQAHVVNVVKAYMKRYPIETEPFEVLETEQEVRVLLPSSSIFLNVKIDMTCGWMNGLWCVDHKSSSRLGDSYFDQFRNHWQTYCYPYAISKLTGRQCEGILYNAIGLKQKIDADSFLRKDFCKTQGQIDYFMRVFTTIATEMIEYVSKHYLDCEKFFMVTTPGGCRSYNKNCPALDYCEFLGNERLLPQERKSTVQL